MTSLGSKHDEEQRRIHIVVSTGLLPSPGGCIQRLGSAVSFYKTESHKIKVLKLSILFEMDRL